MAYTRGFFGAEGGGNDGCTSCFNMGFVCDGTARSGNWHLTLETGSVADSANRISWVSTAAYGTGMTAGQHALGMLRAYLRIRRYPSAAMRCFGWGRSTYSTQGGLRINTDGTFAAGTAYGNSSYSTAVLALDTWYEVTVVCDIVESGVSDSMTVTVTVREEDGTLVDTKSKTETVDASHGMLEPTFCQEFGNATTNSIDLDDVVWAIADKTDYATLLADGLPTQTRIAGFQPKAEGSLAQFTGGWQNVMDTPRYTGATTDISSSTNGNQHLFTKPTAAELGVSDIWGTHIRAGFKTSSNGNDAIMWNGTEYTVALTTSYPSGSAYPTGKDYTSAIAGSGMTVADFDAAEFGVQNKRGVAVQLANIYGEVLHGGTRAQRPEVTGGEASWSQQTGVYSGTGAIQKITTPWRPSVILVKKSGGANHAGVWWCGAMPPGVSKGVNSNIACQGTAMTGQLGDAILFVEDDGFTIGANTACNQSTIQYKFLALRDGGNGAEGYHLVSGGYVGNAVDGRDVVIQQAANFQPDLVITFGGSGGLNVYRDSVSFAGDSSMRLGSTATVTNGIQALNADGFEVGTDNDVNVANGMIFYLAIRLGAVNALDAFFKFGSFTATGGTTVVTGVGFQPDLVIGDRPNTSDAHWRGGSVTLHTGTASHPWATSNATVSTAFTAIGADGFTCGALLSVNTETTRWVAFLDTGDVPVPPDATEIEFNEGGLVDIGLTWVEITDKLDVMRVHSKVALPDPTDYYGGFKDDRVTQWGRITRALSDREGQYEAAQFSWIQADVDRLYRGLADGVFTRVMKNRPATVRMIDDPSRRLQLIPRTMMKGLVREYKPISPLLWQFTIRDIMAARFSSDNAKSQLPTRLITRADFPDCPTDSLNLPVPIIYGEVSDEASDTAPPVLTGTAAVGSYVEGEYRRHGLGPSSSAAAIPTSVVVGLASGGTLSVDVPNGEYAVLVTSVDASGVESDPHVYYYDGPNGGRGSFGDGPLSAYTVTPDGTQKIQVSWSAAAGAVTYRAYLAWYYYGARFTQVIETASTSCEFTANPAWGDEATADNITPAADVVSFGEFWWYCVAAQMSDGLTAHSMVGFGHSKPYRRAIRVEWEAVAGALSYKVYRRGATGTWDREWTVSSALTYFDDDLLDTGVTYIDGAPAPKGLVPVVPVGSMEDSSGFRWKAFVVAGHAIKAITNVFLNGERVDPGNFGVTWAVPGQTGYSTYFPNTGSSCQYLDINGNRYTMLFVRGPDAESGGHGGDDVGGDHGAGESKQITLNVQGIEDVGDSSGDLITDGLLQYLHVIQNWVLDVYESGAWLTTPNFADDAALPMIDEASFTTASGVAATRISGGYVGAWMLGAKGERISVRDMVARLNVSFDVDSGFNRKTQFFVSMVDESLAALDAASSMIDVRDVHEGTFSVEPVDSEHFNRFAYYYGRDYTGQRPTGWIASGEESDATSISDLDETKSAPDLELWCVRSAGQALDVVYRRLTRAKEPPLRVVWTTGMAGLSDELGDIKLATHFGGLGTDGYEARPVRIIRHETDPEKYTVTLEAWDMQRLFEGTLILGDTATLPAAWTSATSAQQRYGYLCDETTGLFSDNKRGKRLR